jgi:hypothetical protein
VESMEMALGAIPHLGRVLEHRLLSPDIGLRWRQCCGTFPGWRLDNLGFSRRRDYIGGRAMSEGGPLPTPHPAAATGGAPPGGVATLVPSSVSALDSVSCRKK